MGIYTTCFLIYWDWLNHHLMVNIWEKAKSILAGNLNSGLSYIIITVLNSMFRSGLVDMLVTHANKEGFGLTPLSREPCGYMPPLLKTKTLDYILEPKTLWTLHLLFQYIICLLWSNFCHFMSTKYHKNNLPLRHRKRNHKKRSI